MKIHVSLISGAITEVDLDEDKTINDIAEFMAKEKGILVSQIKLLCNKKFLKNETKISESGINENSKIILMIQKSKPKRKIQQTKTVPPPKVNSQENSSNKAISDVPLPEFKQNNVNDPPDFEEKVKSLEAMGFNYSNCCSALRAALYNSEMAADFLLSGNIPDAPVIPQQATIVHENMKEESLFNDEEEEEQLVTQSVINDLYEHPENINSFLDKLVEIDPLNSVLIKNNPALVLAQLGIDPTKFDLSSFQTKSMFSELMSKFTKEEQDAINRLAAKGYDTMTVIQVFEACNKNEELTLQCLQ